MPAVSNLKIVFPLAETATVAAKAVAAAAKATTLAAMAWEEAMEWEARFNGGGDSV